MIHWQPHRRRRGGPRWRLRTWINALTVSGVSLIVLSALRPEGPILVYNASASVPLGFYRVTRLETLRTGDLVLARIPATMAELAEQRGYLPQSVPLIKHIAALPGDTVCANGATIWINGEARVTRRTHDRAGRVLPWWTGCQTLSKDEVFLLNPDVADSFDSRYFGTVSTQALIGKVHTL